MVQKIVKRNSVVLIRYPFTDLTGVKVRPAVILTPDHLLNKLDDVLSLFISSVIPEELLSTDFIFKSEHPSFFKTGLKQRSIFRAHKLALLHKSLILRNLGEVEKNIMKEIDKKLIIALGLSEEIRA